MKIAIISPPLDISGGGQREVLELARNLNNKGYIVDIFTEKVNKIECHPNLINDINIITINKNIIDYKIKKLEITDSIIKKIYKYIINLYPIYKMKKDFIDIIKKNNIEKLYNIINYHDEMIFLSKYFKKDLNYWMMNDFPGSIDLKMKGLLDKNSNILTKIDYIFTKKKLKRILKNINKIIVLDNINKDNLYNLFSLNSIIVKSGIDINKFYNEKEFIAKKSYNLLCTSIFFKHRRYEDVINALNILINIRGIKNIHLNIIGKKETDLGYYNSIVNLIKLYNIEKYITFKGKVNEQDLINTYRNSDIFIFPNSPQTWGLAVFEAMLSGCATIVTNGCGASEILTNHINSCIAESKNPESISNEIEYLINNPDKMANIITNGQKFVIDNISWDKYTNEMINIFNT